MLQYLYISIRNMKYLMDYNYISHENAGYEMHKYRVNTEEAEKFKYRMEKEEGFLTELTGKFFNRIEHHPRLIVEPPEKVKPSNCGMKRIERSFPMRCLHKR